MANAQRPTHEIRIGTIKATLWPCELPSGDIRYDVVLRRLYKDGEKWKTADNFGRDDLLVLARVIDRTYDWILSVQAE